MDQFDRASELEEKAREIALDEAKRQIDFISESEKECIRCDEKIPEDRRKIGGVKRCIGCQEWYEKKTRN